MAAEFDSVQTQLGDLGSQRSNAEVQAMSNRAEPEERLRQLATAETQQQQAIAQADLQLQQQISALDEQERQLRAQLPSVEARIAELEKTLADEASQAENEQSLTDRLQVLETDLERSRAERAELEQLVEATRDVTSGSGAEDLSRAYTDDAERHSAAWKRWLGALAVSISFALVGGTATIVLLHPDANATNAELVTYVGIELLVVGLLLYVVRVSARQFSAHRHLETLSRGKAAALSTFNRLVSGPSEPEVRTAVASALAQAVFSSDDTGFIETSGESVTLIERAVAPIVQRVSP